MDYIYDQIKRDCREFFRGFAGLRDEVPAAFVQVPLVLYMAPTHFEWTYGFPSEDGDDPRFNTAFPVCLKAIR